MAVSAIISLSPQLSIIEPENRSTAPPREITNNFSFKGLLTLCRIGFSRLLSDFFQNGLSNLLSDLGTDGLLNLIKALYQPSIQCLKLISR